MDTKGSSVEFDKMEIKHPDRLAKSSQEDVKLKVYDTENSVDNKPVAKKMMYAEVIDIEDPDKEQLQMKNLDELKKELIEYGKLAGVKNQIGRAHV